MTCKERSVAAISTLSILRPISLTGSLGKIVIGRQIDCSKKSA